MSTGSASDRLDDVLVPEHHFLTIGGRAGNLGLRTHCAAYVEGQGPWKQRRVGVNLSFAPPNSTHCCGPRLLARSLLDELSVMRARSRTALGAPQAWTSTQTRSEPNLLIRAEYVHIRTTVHNGTPILPDDVLQTEAQAVVASV